MLIVSGKIFRFGVFSGKTCTLIYLMKGFHMAKTMGFKGAKRGASVVGRGVFRPLGGGLVVPTWAGFGCLVMTRLACAVAGICGCGRTQQPCHPHAGMCAAWDLWLRTYHPSQYENPTLHIGVR